MKKIYIALSCIILLSFSNVFSQTVVINEVLASNTNGTTDEDGSHQDWIEIYNVTGSPINLNGYGLSDEAENLLKWKFPNVTLDAHGFIRIWCSDKNRAIVGQPLHTNFKINASGEAIYISDANGNTLDNSPSVALDTDISYGRFPDGTGSFVFFSDTTPGAPNSSSGYSEVLGDPVFSHDSGFFTDGFNLTISTSTPGATIIYTLDGSEPDASNLGGTTYNYKNQYPENPGQAFGPMLYKSFTSNQYSAPLSIGDYTLHPNNISEISSTFDFNPDYLPSFNIYKAEVVKAKIVKPGAMPSKTITRTFFITPLGSNRFSLPVVSISIDENKLFDYEDGIYVAGQTFDQFRTDFPNDPADYPIGNYTLKGPDYERKGNFSYFVNGVEKINQDIGIRIQGNYSRLYPSKSMNIYSKPDYGVDGLHYKFFSDEPYNNFARVVLKNSASDFYNSFFKDSFCSELAKTLHTQTEANQPVVTFINGEYWGLLTIRERYDAKFFNRVYNIPEDKIDLLENDGDEDDVQEGNSDDYLDMINYLQNNSLVADANYSYIKTRMDTESFTDYFITNIFLQNEDWPGNNIVFWRKETAYDANAPYGSDGRWRWAVHDMSSTMNDGDFNINVLALATDPIGQEFPNPTWSTLILRRLLDNADYKKYFINRFADILNTSFHTNRSLPMINAMKAQIQPEMAEQISRWKAPISLSEWDFFTGQLTAFMEQRPDIQRSQIRSKFNIDSDISATLDVSDADAGFIHINTVDIKNGTDGVAENPYPWTGIYFSNISVTLKAIANPGYVFDHWEGASNATTDEIILTPAAAFSVKAVFTQSTVAQSEPIYFWLMDGNIANNQPLTSLNTTYKVTATDGSISYTSCLAGYPFTSADPLWRHASMERRNNPTSVNYIPEANGNIAYSAGIMKGLQITEPLQSGTAGNTMVFNFSTSGYKDIKFSFAAVNELTNATGILIDYSVDGTNWITTGLTSTTLPLTSAYQLFNVDFTSITAANNNANFKVRVRFTGNNMDADAGNRITFNNISVLGAPLELSVDHNDDVKFTVYPNPVSSTLNISGINGESEYRISAIDGKIIDSGKLNAASQINVEELTSGIYLLQITSDGRTETKKIVKK